MYQSTEAFGNLIQQDSRTFKSLITYDDIELDTTTLIYKLRQEQDKIFG